MSKVGNSLLWRLSTEAIIILLLISETDSKSFPFSYLVPNLIRLSSIQDCIPALSQYCPIFRMGVTSEINRQKPRRVWISRSRQNEGSHHFSIAWHKYQRSKVLFFGKHFQVISAQVVLFVLVQLPVILSNWKSHHTNWFEDRVVISNLSQYTLTFIMIQNDTSNSISNYNSFST